MSWVDMMHAAGRRGVGTRAQAASLQGPGRRFLCSRLGTPAALGLLSLAHPV